MEMEKDQCLPGVKEEGRMNKQSTDDFLGSENTLYDPITVDTCHYTFVQTRRTYNTMSQP